MNFKCIKKFVRRRTLRYVSPGQIEQSREKNQSWQPVAQPRYELCTPRIKERCLYTILLVTILKPR